MSTATNFGVQPLGNHAMEPFLLASSLGVRA